MSPLELLAIFAAGALTTWLAVRRVLHPPHNPHSHLHPGDYATRGLLGWRWRRPKP